MHYVKGIGAVFFAYIFLYQIGITYTMQRFLLLLSVLCLSLVLHDDTEQNKDLVRVVFWLTLLGGMFIDWAVRG